MDPGLARMVRQRSGNRCEYCRLSQSYSALSLHIEHVIPRQHGGTDSLDNLALACPDCNLRKGPNLTSIDPDSGSITPLFNPRKNRWEDHFLSNGAHLGGITPVGRTTAWLLDVNSTDRIKIREILVHLGHWP